jgi:hypothetical protein
MNLVSILLDGETQMKQVIIAIKDFDLEWFIHRILDYFESTDVIQKIRANGCVPFEIETSKRDIAAELAKGRRLFFPFSDANMDDFEVECMDGRTRPVDETILDEDDSVGYAMSVDQEREAYIIDSAIEVTGARGKATYVRIGRCGKYDAPMRKYLDHFIRNGRTQRPKRKGLRKLPSKWINTRRLLGKF